MGYSRRCLRDPTISLFDRTRLYDWKTDRRTQSHSTILYCAGTASRGEKSACANGHPSQFIASLLWPMTLLLTPPNPRL